MSRRSTLAAVCLFLVALSGSQQAFSYGGTSDIVYVTDNEVLSGYSRTWREWTDDYYTNDCYEWTWDDIWGYWCPWYREAYYFPYAVADVYTPSSALYSSTGMGDWDDAWATFSHSVTTSSPGVWSLVGRHYVVEDFVTWYCWMGPQYCYPVSMGTNWHHLGNTSDTAVVLVCIHKGTPTNGSLSGDNSLSDNGTGYYHFLGTDAPNTDDWACDIYANQKVHGVGLWWNQSPKIGIGDLSLQGGGPWVDHDSHENGLDVDVRYVRNDGQEAALDLNANPTLYDQAKTQQVVERFCLLGGASVIFVDSQASLTASCVQVLSGHHNHFHVRFPDPD